MSRSKGARLWLRPEKRGAKGQAVRRSTWIIRDGDAYIATGCPPGEARSAEEALARYIAAKYQPARRRRDIDDIDIADVLSIYADDRGPLQSNTAKLDERIRRLALFWGGKPLSAVTGATCREYAAWRKNEGGARRDLEDLRAAIKHHAKEGLHRGIVAVTLPPKGLPRDRWLTRSEAAKLLWACWRAREIQTVHRGPRKGEKIETDKRPLRHLARFILIGLYTGTRAGAIASASPSRGEGRSFVDLDRGVFYRLAQGRRATAKRQPPVPLPPGLLAHLRRWTKPVRDHDGTERVPEHFVEFNGRAVASVKTAFKRGVKLAKIARDEQDRITPHTLRHTAATWLMQEGIEIWLASGFLGMSPKTLTETYGHHHPDYLAPAANALRNRKRSAPVPIPVPVPKDLPTKVA